MPWPHKIPESDVESGGKGDTKVCLEPLSRFKAKEGVEFRVCSQAPGLVTVSLSFLLHSATPRTNVPPTQVGFH